MPILLHLASFGDSKYLLRHKIRILNRCLVPFPSRAKWFLLAPYRPEFAGLFAEAALGAGLRIYFVGLLELPVDGLGRADLGAKAAALALLRDRKSVV